MKKFLLSILFCALSFAVYAQAGVGPSADAILPDGRWYNDEYSFDFANDLTYKAFYTFGDKTGSMTGRVEYAPGSDTFSIVKGTVEGTFDISFMTGNKVKMDIFIDSNDPKSSRYIKNADDSLILWNKNYFVREEKKVEINGAAAVTMGYKLRATTENLRIRKGPSTNDEHLTFFFKDTKSGQIKSWGSLLAGTNIRVLARTESKQKVEDWNNYWYYVEYKEPKGSMVVYKRAWSYAEFINTDSNVARMITITSPRSDSAYYGEYTVDFKGTVTGKPTRLKVQIKNSDGTVSREMSVSVAPATGAFTFEAGKSNNTLHYGSNIYNFIAEYYDGKTTTNQITLYLHESMGEKAKPVIYLYPEKKMKVDVTVAPKQGISVSDPAYNNGWSVIANPDGMLTNIADSRVYPYLFWESPEDDPSHPDTGFVVKTSDLAGFFTEKLSYMGLNKQEIKDFNDFWLPILNKGNYYYIHFYSAQAIDEAAPLTVTPKPDSVIRVYFDSTPLDAPIKIPAQTLEKGVRKGFTVIEWGGRRY
ncbi:MAG: hypothetical protein JW904_01385 [Spirochaetales bacterium]|nr:hypothetical protein [Spirochaetales bacterium]